MISRLAAGAAALFLLAAAPALAQEATAPAAKAETKAKAAPTPVDIVSNEMEILDKEKKAVFRGAVGGYSLTIDRAARTAIVSDATPGRDGTDLLRQVEKVQFGTQVFDLFNPARTSVPAYKANRDFLFDPAYYLLSNPTLATSVTMDAASTHYLSAGAAQGLRPNAWFDASYYANRWPDLKAANLDTATLFLHYNLYGVWEGRSAGPVFDTYDGTRYLRDNPDVAAYVDGHVADFLGSRTNGAIAHYVIYGADEGRVAYDAAGVKLEAAVVVGVVA